MIGTEEVYEKCRVALKQPNYLLCRKFLHISANKILLKSIDFIVGLSFWLVIHADRAFHVWVKTCSNRKMIANAQ